MARCRITVLTLGFTFNFFLLFTFMKHLQTYIRPDTSLLPVRRWKKSGLKDLFIEDILADFFSSFFLSNVKSSPRASQDQQKVWFCHHPRQYLGKALPSFLPMLPVQHGMRSNATKKNPTPNSLMSHQAELSILTLRDDSPIPLPFFSWYSIFNLQRWQLLPCFMIRRKHWDNLKVLQKCKGLQKTSWAHSQKLPFCSFYHDILGYKHKRTWIFLLLKDIKMQ